MLRASWIRRRSSSSSSDSNDGGSGDGSSAATATAVLAIATWLAKRTLPRHYQRSRRRRRRPGATAILESITQIPGTGTGTGTEQEQGQGQPARAMSKASRPVSSPAQFCRLLRWHRRRHGIPSLLLPPSKCAAGCVPAPRVRRLMPRMLCYKQRRPFERPHTEHGAAAVGADDAAHRAASPSETWMFRWRAARRDGSRAQRRSAERHGRRQAWIVCKVATTSRTATAT